MCLTPFSQRCGRKPKHSPAQYGTGFQTALGPKPCLVLEFWQVSAVLKTHPVVGDALVTAFDGPLGSDGLHSRV